MALAMTSAVLVGCGDDDTVASTTPASDPPGTTGVEPAPADADVVIDTFIFGPDPVVVDAGATIVFRNDDDILHTVTQGTRDEPVAAGFDLQLDGAGTTGEIEVGGTGTIEYFCSIHAGMDAQITVR